MLKQKKYNIIFIIIAIIISIYLINKIEYKKELIIEKNIVNKIISNATNNKKNDKYYMYISIPSINLNKGIYSYNNKYNDIKYGIELLKSDNPNIKNGNLILASHRGNSKVSFFDKLDQMKVNDKIIINYKNINYTYKYKEKYEIEKTGKALIKRNNNKNTITLITCKKHSKDKQIIYIGYLE